MRLLNIYIIGALLLIGFLSLHNVNGAKILGLFTSHSPSHFIVHMSVAKYLAEAGHNITVVSTLKPKITHPSIKHVIIPLTEEQEKDINSGMEKMINKGKNIITMLIHILTAMTSMFSLQFEALLDERFAALQDENFDLVVMGYFMNDFQLKVAAKYKCPVIVTWTGPPMGFVAQFIGNPSEIAYVPSMQVALKAGESMSFLQRIKNFFDEGVMNIFRMFLDIYNTDYYDKLFPNEKGFPTLQEMRKNVSLLFCNSHFSEGPIRPNVPAVVEIGGIQIKDKPDTLPKDIAEYLDSATKNGFILLSLGSNVQGSQIRPEIIQTIFKTLSSLKQKVIWKWEDLNNVPGKSPNILFKKWLPQDDILAHKNIRLFITHAGKGGIAEAQYHGVPMLAIPVFGDQPANAVKMNISGYGIQLDLLTMTANEFKNGVLEVLENPKYKENIKKFSELYRDRPQKAQESVVYWTEYVLRHHGAKHMQSPLIHLNFFQKTSLDLVFVLLLIVYVVFKIIKFIFKTIYQKLKSKKQLITGEKLKKK